MSQSQPTILGTAAGIAAVLDESSLCSLYGPEAARIGENLRRHDTVSINDFLAKAEGYSGPILDLGAGTGRLTVPLLEKGHEVVALDLSNDMLDILRERLKSPDSQAYAERATLVTADMTDFNLHRTFGLMTMAGAAIWTIDADKRAKMFQRVSDHLADDGKLVVELVTLDAFVDRSSPAFEQTTVFSLSDNSTPYICTFFDYVDPGEGIRCGSVLAHRIEDGKVAKTLLGTAMSYPVPIPELEKEVERAGLRVRGTQEISKDLPGASPLRKQVHVLLVEITK